MKNVDSYFFWNLYRNLDGISMRIFMGNCIIILMEILMESVGEFFGNLDWHFDGNFYGNFNDHFDINFDGNLKKILVQF